MAGIVLNDICELTCLSSQLYGKPPKETWAIAANASEKAKTENNFLIIRLYGFESEDNSILLKQNDKKRALMEFLFLRSNKYFSLYIAIQNNDYIVGDIQKQLAKIYRKLFLYSCSASVVIVDMRKSNIHLRRHTFHV